MTTFDDRENAFENKFAHDEEMNFRAEARRNKLLGLWAAELMGKTGEDADAYAKEVVKSADTIRNKMAEFLIVAKGQIMNEV